MDRKKATLTPEQYAKAIIALSRRYSSTSVFPGNHYLDLAEWMLQERSVRSSAQPAHDPGLFASPSQARHDLVVVYNGGDKKWGVQQYGQEDHKQFSSNGPLPEDGLVQLVFLRGFVSPSWVSAIGSKYRLDPEFFRRHMDFLSVNVDRHAYSFPSLASTSDNIVRLCVSTLLHKDHFGERDLHAERLTQASQLGAYKTQQLGSTKVHCGDSLVREYSTLCSSFSVLEQWISICITKQEKGWTVIAWMDQGRPLEQSPPGPWTVDMQSKATALPVVQIHHKMAFRTTTNRLVGDANASAEVQQSAAILPLQYDSLLALVDLARRAPQDPLSVSVPLFAHAAFSEQQFLNLVESRIQTQINDVSEGVPADAVGTFQYFSNILNRHVQQLRDNLRALNRLAERHNQASTDGSRRGSAETEASRSGGGGGYDGTFTVKGLLEDYEELHTRCLDLSQMCTRGITLAMNKATIDESRKGIEQSERVKKLTLLATFFIPLSFCSSLFGMNFDVLGQSSVSVWWFFVLCVPITLLAYAMYLWDWPALRILWARARRKGGRDRVRAPDRVGEESGKGPDLMV